MTRLASTLAMLLILPACGAAPIDQRFPDAVPILTAEFESTSDHDFDGWPDGWTRQRGPGYPAYMEVRIQPTDGASGESALHVACNGGAAAAFSPPVPITPRFAYVFEGSLRTEGLSQNSARWGIVFLNEQKRPIEEHFCLPLRGTTPWTKIRIGPIQPRRAGVRYAVIVARVGVGAAPDLTGEVWFDDAWLARTPRLSVKTSTPHGFYTDAADVAIAGELSGVESHTVTVRSQLLDVTGAQLEQHEQQLTLTEVAPVTATGDPNPANPLLTSKEFAGAFAWKPHVQGVGFYRIRVSIIGRAGTLHQQDMPVLVVPDDDATAGLEFGWSLPRGDDPIPLADLPRLFLRSGVQRVKFPVWFSEEDGERAQGLANFAERLSNRQIELIGLLNDPPAAVRKSFQGEGELLAIDVFSRPPDLWYPSLEPVLTRLSLSVRYWQLGDDRDTSLVGAPNLTARVGEVKRQLDHVGQDLHLGFGWDWQHELPVPHKPMNAASSALPRHLPWRYVSLASSPSLTPEELASYLRDLNRTRGERWVSIRPLERSRYDLPTRVNDLVQQMVTAKSFGVEGIFLDDPFDDECGLLDSQGRPTELLLAWRTTALALAQARYLGRIDLPEGSANAIFERGGKGLIFLSAGRPVRELLRWGPEARLLNAWGQTQELPREDGKQAAEIGAWPVFVEGADLPLLAWRSGVRLSPERVPSVLGTPHELTLTVRNTFNQEVSGTAQLVGPESWRLDSFPIDFSIPPGKEITLPIEINLPVDAGMGSHVMRVDFELNADDAYHFSAYPRLEVGAGDVNLEVSTRLNDHGQLEIEQRLTNLTDDEVTFKCYLSAPERRRMRRQIVEHRRGTDVQSYLLKDGRQLLGKTLYLRAEEVGGSRTLNLPFVAEP
ncbi:MAG: hypothetical protein K1X74_14440 [Pirellulales bacterium]|nr:hypothetical protein [Pirellulales bacterium]